MNYLRAHWILTVGLLYLLPEGRRTYWSCKKWVGSDKIFFAICSVLDLYNCSRLVSGVQQPVILHEMVRILFNFSLFLTERFPHQQTRQQVVTFFTNKLLLTGWAFVRHYSQRHR